MKAEARTMTVLGGRPGDGSSRSGLGVPADSWMKSSVVSKRDQKNSERHVLQVPSDNSVEHVTTSLLVQVMDTWKIAVMGDGGVGKTALAVQVRSQALGITQIFFTDHSPQVYS